MGTTNLVPLPFMGVGVYKKSRAVSTQERLNLYTEINADAEKQSVTYYPTPGLEFMLSFGAEPCRGLYAVGTLRYAVHRNGFFSISNNNVTTLLGILTTTTGRVSISDNGIQIIIVDGTTGAPGGGYVWNMNTSTFTKITDVDFPGGDTVTFMNGYFIINKPNSGQVFYSALYDGLTWDALQFFTAESNPDNLVAVQANNGQLILYGDKTTELWGDSGALDLPFARIGAAAIEWGAAARWSIVKFMDAIVFLRKNRLGQVQVCVMDSGVAVAVSPPNLDMILQDMPAVADATAFAFMVSGHPIYQINFPSANQSWQYDGLSKEWHRVSSDAKSIPDRHIAEIQYNHEDYSFVSDYANGNIYKINADVLTDNGMQVARQWVSRYQTANNNWSVIDELQIEMEAGIAQSIGQGSDPVIMLQVSKDNGATWGLELWRSFGKIGENIRRAVWRRLGRSRTWLVKVRVTDPVKTVFVAVWGRGGF